MDCQPRGAHRTGQHLVDGRYRVQELYTAEAVAKVNTLSGCFIELSKVFPAEQ